MRLDRSLLDRRQFLDGVMGAGVIGLGATAGETVLGFLTGLEEPEPDHIVLAGPMLETLSQKQYVLAPYGPRPVMVFRLPSGELRALSAVCTHGQCNVRYRPETNDIYCACHQGRFTAEGINVPGTPPPRPLRTFHIRRQDDGTLIVAAEPFEPGPSSNPTDTP